MVCVLQCLRGDIMEKNSNYTFRCNEVVKEEFKALCRVGKVSPSDVLQAVMMEFNENTKRIAQMKDVGEIRALLQEKMDCVSGELQHIEEHPTFQK